VNWHLEYVVDRRAMERVERERREEAAAMACNQSDITQA
jgi:hypothetical protein